MAAQTVQLHLAEVLQKEAVPHDAASLRLIARAARGSMRDAMSLTDQAIAFGGGGLQEDVVRQMLGAVDRSHVQRLIEAVADGDGAALVTAVDALRDRGLSAAGTLEELAAALQRMAVVQAVPALAGDADDPDAETWARLAPRLAPDETQLFYSLCLQGRAELALAPDEYSGLLMLMLRLLAFKPGSALSRGGGDPKAEGSAARPAAEPASRSQVAAPAAKPPSPTLAQDRPAMSPSLRATEPQPPSQLPPSASGAPVPAAPAGGADLSAGVPRAVSAGQPLPSPDALRAGASSREAPGLVPSSAPPWDDEPPLAEPDAAPAAPAFDEGPPPELPPEALADAGLVAAPGQVPAWEPHVPDVGPAAAPPLGAQSAEPDPMADLWADVVAQLQSRGLITALVRELAVQSQCLSHHVDTQAEHWQLRVERVSLMGEMHRERLEQALASLSGREVRLELLQGAAINTPAQRDLAAREARQRAAEALVAADPLVRRLMADHPGARILPGSVRPL
jgi:DNA polymerase-3 subunit gamma/tau